MCAPTQTVVRGGLPCLLVLFGTLVAQADSVLVQRVRTEAAQAWRDRLNDRIAIQGICHQTLKDEKGERPGTVDVMFNTNCALSKLMQSTGVTDLFCYNPKYTFHLRSQPNQGWVIMAFHEGDPALSPDAKEVRARLDRQVWVFEAGLRDPLYGDPLFAYLEAPTARVESTPGLPDRPGLVEMKLDMGPHTKGQYVRTLTSLLDPSHGWRPVRTTMITEPSGGTGEYTAEYEYAPGQDGLLQRAHIKANWKLKGGKTTRTEYDRRFELRRVTSFPDTKEFTLSAFGLPEPVGVEWPRQRTGWLWLVWAAAGFVMVAAVFIALKRRATRRPAVVQPTPS